MAIATQQTGQFDGYTLSDLRSLTLRMLRVADTVRYSPTAGAADYDWIDDALNRAQENFVRKTLCLRTYAVVELKANYRTYRLPWNFLDFLSAYFYDATLAGGYRELHITTIEELNDEVYDWRTNTGNPTQVYMDRIYGNNWMFGLYPIPDSDGEAITFDSEYGAVVQWVCPAYTYNQDYGVILQMSEADEYYLSSDSGIVGTVHATSGNMWLEYYRLPSIMSVITQYPEIPREYQKAMAYFAVSDLLQNNPEDSAEFKRGLSFEKRFQAEIDTYIDKRKKPLAGHALQARALIWPNVVNLPFYKGLA